MTAGNASKKPPTTIYPEVKQEIPAPDSSTRHTTDPQLALAGAVLDASKHERVASRLPLLQKSAYLLLALALFSAAQILFATKLLSSDYTASGLLYTVFGAGWTLEVIAALVVLATKSMEVVKLSLIVIGLTIAYGLAVDLRHLAVIGSAIDAAALWWTYRLYRAVGGLA